MTPLQRPRERTRALILLVDDSATQAHQAVQALEAAGFRVRLAADGREALAQARRWRPDVIVSDILMPVMDGFALCREVRRDPALAQVPVVLQTGTYVDSKDEEFALGIGATRFLVKPADPASLVDTVRETLATGHAAPSAAPSAHVAPAADDGAFFQGYSQRLAAKLEEKVAELEAAYRRLEQQSQTQLRRAETRYRVLVEHLPVVTYNAVVERREGPLAWRYRYVSPQIEPLLGFSAAEWLNAPHLWQQRLHPDDRDRVRAELASGLAGNGFDVEYRLLARDGRVRWIHDRAVVLRDGAADAGGAEFVQGVLVDVSERKQAEVERARLTEEIDRERATLEATMAGMTDGLAVVMGAERQVRYFTARAAALVGVSREEALGQPLDVVISRFSRYVADPAAFAAARQEAIAHVEDKPSFEASIPGPPRRDLQFHYFPIADGRAHRLGYGCLMRDVTHEREVQRMKDEFVAVISHELRTPLASVLGFAELLLNRDFAPERRREFLLTIHTDATRLKLLIDDFLDLQRLESGRLEYAREEIDVRALVEDAVAPFGLQPGPHMFRVEAPDTLPPLVGDRTRLRQVLVNLLGNAVKYAPQGGEVVVAVQPRGQRLEIAVRDQGLGLPPDAIPKLFQKFYRVDTSDRREIGGTGLGLAICREIVEAHGGRIWAESAGLQQGSTFGFTLPLPAAATASAGRVVVGAGGTSGAARQRPGHPRPHAEDRWEEGHAVPIATGEGAPRRVLLVEDDPGLVRLYREQLETAGYAVEAVPNGAGALARVRAAPPDAVVLDVLLPGRLDGWDVLTQLKTDPTTHHVPVVMATVVDEAARGITLGATDYLVKPVNTGHLLRLLAGLTAGAARDVLIVDDDAHLRQVLAEILGLQGYTTRQAADGAAALAEIARRRPDLVLLDLLMPGMDGFAVLDRLRACQSAPAAPGDRDGPDGVCAAAALAAELPVIVLTGKDLTPEERQLLAARSVPLLRKDEHAPAAVLVALQQRLGPPRRAAGVR